MDNYQKTFKAWNSIALDYEVQFMELKLYNDTYDYFRKALPYTNTKILEIGCGPGNITKYLARHCPELSITAIDISDKMIERAKSHAPKVKYELMDVRNLHLLEGEFDGIICGFTLPYLSAKDRDKLVSDCSKLLSNKGVLYLSYVPGAEKEPKLIQDKSGNAMRFYFHDNENVKSQLKDYSFELMKEFLKSYRKKDGSEELHSILIVRKIGENF